MIAMLFDDTMRKLSAPYWKTELLSFCGVQLVIQFVGKNIRELYVEDRKLKSIGKLDSCDADKLRLSDSMPGVVLPGKRTGYRVGEEEL